MLLSQQQPIDMTHNETITSAHTTIWVDSCQVITSETFFYLFFLFMFLARYWLAHVMHSVHRKCTAGLFPFLANLRNLGSTTVRSYLLFLHRQKYISSLSLLLLYPSISLFLLMKHVCAGVNDKSECVGTADDGTPREWQVRVTACHSHGNTIQSTNGLQWMTNTSYHQSYDKVPIFFSLF